MNQEKVYWGLLLGLTIVEEGKPDRLYTCATGFGLAEELPLCQ